jgi:hypothetical protein
MRCIPLAAMLVAVVSVSGAARADVPSVEQLRAALAKDERTAALERVSHLATPLYRTLLTQLAADENNVTRYAAIEALGAAIDTNATNVLYGILADSTRDLGDVTMAAYALAHTCSERAYRAIGAAAERIDASGAAELDVKTTTMMLREAQDLVCAPGYGEPLVALVRGRAICRFLSEDVQRITFDTKRAGGPRHVRTLAPTATQFVLGALEDGKIEYPDKVDINHPLVIELVDGETQEIFVAADLFHVVDRRGEVFAIRSAELATYLMTQAQWLDGKSEP